MGFCRRVLPHNPSDFFNNIRHEPPLIIWPTNCRFRCTAVIPCNARRFARWRSAARAFAQSCSMACPGLHLPRLAFRQPHRLGEFRQRFRLGAGREASEPHGLDMPQRLGGTEAWLIGDAFRWSGPGSAASVSLTVASASVFGPEPRSSRRVRPMRIYCSCRASGAPSL